MAKKQPYPVPPIGAINMLMVYCRSMVYCRCWGRAVLFGQVPNALVCQIFSNCQVQL